LLVVVVVAVKLHLATVAPVVALQMEMLWVLMLAVKETLVVRILGKLAVLAAVVVVLLVHKQATTAGLVVLVYSHQSQERQRTTLAAVVVLAHTPHQTKVLVALAAVGRVLIGR
jgi:hypothetical protein|tara:strand:+ start:79 stop:420 length:342 start_codon:yes stop_codon:yes gene_type:complete